MKYKNIIILISSNMVIIFITIFYVNEYFWYKIENIHKEYKKNLEKKLEKEHIENTIQRNYFEDTFELFDYSNTKYTLEEEGKQIIQNIRTFHKSPNLIDKEKLNREVCAWFIWVLTEKIWWKNLPYYVWMMDQESKTPASAWKLPIAYQYFWWEILSDFSRKFDIYKKDMWEKISFEEINWFF